MIWNENRPGATVCCIPRSVSSERVLGTRKGGEAAKLWGWRMSSGDLTNPQLLIY